MAEQSWKVDVIETVSVRRRYYVLAETETVAEEMARDGETYEELTLQGGEVINREVINGPY